MSETCTRPEWSNENNDYCMCDALDDMAELSLNTCEECSYWKERDE